MASVDILVMGRKTFEKVLSFGAWPYGDKPVVVLSRGGRGVRSQPIRPVGAHRIDDRQQCAALLGQHVLDARRHFGMRVAGDDALVLDDLRQVRDVAGHAEDAGHGAL